jgi:hypothetical protein
MKKYILFLLLFTLGHQLLAQVRFVERFELESEMDDPLFEMIDSKVGLISFRTLREKGLTMSKNFQYFVSDSSLKSAEGIIEFPVRDAFDILGYDVDEQFLFVLFTRGTGVSAPRYILRVNLETKQGLEFEINNVLDMELVEFLVQDQKVMFMGSSEGRPVMQIYDLLTKSVQTLQGIYGNDTQILQIRKMPEVKSLEVVLSRKGLNRSRDIFINTYDMAGNVMRELKVDEFAEPGQEILDGLLVSSGNYQEAMIGAFGLDRRNDYQGMYIMDINEFGEFAFKLYTLEDFPNFYNYLNEKTKLKRDESVLKELEKEKTPVINSVYSIRDVRQTPYAYYVSFDQYTVSNSRSRYQNGYSTAGGYRNDRWSRMGTTVINDPFITNTGIPGTTQSVYQSVPEYRYISAHFVKVAKTGQVVWDNAISYNEMVTTYPESFGEVAVVGEDMYHMFVDNDMLRLSFFRNGEKIFENQEFEIGLVNEEERIRDSNVESFRLIHWYDRYYLLSGTQRIRFLNEKGMDEVREVYFLTKIAVDGDLYKPEELPD